MIVKIKTHKKPSFRKLLEYMLNDKDRLSDKDNRSFLITHNMKGKGIDTWVKQFQYNETFRKHKRKNSVYVHHEILSWHRDDIKNISADKLRDMVREYLPMRNPNGMYVAVPHFDRDHFHVHICSSGIQYRNGKSMRMSRKEFAELKKNIQEYQIEKFPELSKSVVEHGKKKNRRILTDEEHHYTERTGKQTKKDELLSILNDCSAHATSMEDFFERMKENNLQPYERNGKITGVIYNKRKYRFKRLGIDLVQFKSLQKENSRENELQKLREKTKEKNVRRSRRH